MVEVWRRAVPAPDRLVFARQCSWRAASGLCGELRTRPRPRLYPVRGDSPIARGLCSARHPDDVAHEESKASLDAIFVST